jgi:quercetin dioxygenase-like cupin family protein
MKIIHESEVPEVEHPGRFMRWLANDDSLEAKNLSVCVIRVLAGETVRPAHSHPNSEELIYIIEGSGKVMIEGEVGDVRAGSTILFEQGKIHMLRNTGKNEM